jgi:hypothetical protein
MLIAGVWEIRELIIDATPDRSRLELLLLVCHGALEESVLPNLIDLQNKMNRESHVITVASLGCLT